MKPKSVVLPSPLESCHGWKDLALYLNAIICGRCKHKRQTIRGKLACQFCPQALKIHELSKKEEAPQ